MALLLGLHIIEQIPQYIIPISGMTIGNAMIVSGLYLNQMHREIESSRAEVEAVKYQSLIMFAITASAAITAILLSLISYKLWFTKEEALK